jgi:hypothetical protein
MVYEGALNKASAEMTKSIQTGKNINEALNNSTQASIEKRNQQKRDKLDQIDRSRKFSLIATGITLFERAGENRVNPTEELTGLEGTYKTTDEILDQGYTLTRVLLRDLAKLIMNLQKFEALMRKYENSNETHDTLT